MNYEELINEIAETHDLEIVNTTGGWNGYPSQIRPMLIGFKNFQEFKKIAEQYPQLEHYSLDRKDGHQLWGRKSDYFTCGYQLDDVLNDNNIAWYKYSKLDFINHALSECFETLFNDLQDIEINVGPFFEPVEFEYDSYISVEDALSVWEKNKGILAGLMERCLNEDDYNEMDIVEFFADYIDLEPYKDRIDMYEKWFQWFDIVEDNVMLVEDLNSDRIEESEIETCAFYYDTHNYAMALGLIETQNM